MRRILRSALLPHRTRIHTPRCAALHSSQRQPLDCPEIRADTDLETIQRHRTLTPPATTSPSSISIKLAKKLLRREFDADRALALLSSVPPSSSSYKYFLEVVARRLCRTGRAAEAVKLLDSRIPFAAAEADFASILITYGCASIPDCAVSAFKARIGDGALTVSVVSFNALLSAFLRSGRHCEVPDLFESMSKEYGILPDDVSYVILVKSVCMSGKTGDALAILKQMREGEKGVSPTIGMYTTVLDSLYKEKNVDEAERLWNEMVGTGFKPDIVAYNVRIGYHALRAETCKVLELIAEMEKAGVKPNTITYNFLIVCHFGSKQIEDAKMVYKQMVVSNLCSPNAATFRMVLDGLCRRRDFEAGLEVFRDSLRNNKLPDFKTLRVFVEGLVKDGKMDRAKAVVAQVRKRFPENLCIKWKKVEDELGLSMDGDKTSPLQEVTIR